MSKKKLVFVCGAGICRNCQFKCENKTRRFYGCLIIDNKKDIIF